RGLHYSQLLRVGSSQVVSAPTWAAPSLIPQSCGMRDRPHTHVGGTWSRNRVTPSASHRLRTCTGGTRAGGRNSVTSSSSPHLHGPRRRTDSTSTRPTVNIVVPVQDGCGRSLRPAFAWSPPRKSPTAPAPSTAGDTTSRPTANAMRLTPPLVRMVLVRYAAPAPGDSGGLFSSRRCLFARVRG